MQIGFIYSGGMTEYSDGDDADTILRHEDEALDDVKRRRTTPIVTRRHSMLRGLLWRSKDQRGRPADSRRLPHPADRVRDIGLRRIAQSPPLARYPLLRAVRGVITTADLFL